MAIVTSNTSGSVACSIEMTLLIQGNENVT